MPQYIDQLSEELWNLCPQPVAETDEEVKEWYYQPESHLKKFSELVQPLRPSMNSLVQEAINEWQKIEFNLFFVLKINRADFIDEFKKTRELFFSKKMDWQPGIYKYGLLCEGLVRNMEWINAFSWQLPAADPKNCKKYVEIAEVMIAVMYLEILVKYMDEADPDNLNEPLKKIEARYKVVFERIAPH
jgi:hypothetical protein